MDLRNSELCARDGTGLGNLEDVMFWSMDEYENANPYEPPYYYPEEKEEEEEDEET